MGLESVYGKQEVGPDGLTQKQRKFQEDSAKADKMVDEMIMKQLDSIGFSEPSEDEAIKAPKPQPQTARAKASSSSTRPSRNIPTLRSRDAAAALAGPKATVAPAKTAATPKPRIASSLLMPKKKTRVPTNPSPMRNTAATVTSNSTVGYSKGRSVSSTMREKQVEQKKKPSNAQTTLPPETYMQLYGPPPLGSEMWSRCKAAGCFDDPNENAEPEELLPTFEEDEEAENFQLAL